jgi:hypothetical protein
MERIRDWFSRFSSGSTPLNTVTTRADHVVELQAHVSRLQQEILALSNAAASSHNGDTRGDSNAQMASLERQLDEAQRELAKYQGRI